MDALTAANSFATIVQLICNYRSEKGADAALDHQQFVEWLEYHRHEEIKNLICNTAALRSEVDNVLRSDHAKIIAELDAINTTLASLASGVPELRGLTATMLPDAEFSEQAISIVRQLVNSGSKFFSVIKMRGGKLLNLEGGGNIDYSEDRFLDDDLNELASSGLLSMRYSSSGTDQIYGITRNAVRWIEAIDGK